MIKDPFMVLVLPAREYIIHLCCQLCKLSLLTYTRVLMTIIDSDNRHAKTVREGLEHFKSLADSLEGWEFSSEKDGVKLYTKDVPGNPLPMVRGDAVLQLADPDQVPPMAMASASILPGCRKVCE